MWVNQQTIHTAVTAVKMKWLKWLNAVAIWFRIMINFHYSDSWADPGKQYKPATWSGYSTEQLYTAMATLDDLNALKSSGVTPEWGQ